MTTTKLRELDAWIAFHVCEKTTRLIELTESNCWLVPCYSTDPAAAMEVLKKCCEHMMENHYIKERALGPCKIWQTSSFEWCLSIDRGDYICSKTLELAICQFAKKLFTKD